MGEATTNIQTLTLDPLRTLTVREVVERTGVPQRTIFRYLADDVKNKNPGHSFPRPAIGVGKRLRWREVAIARWMERHEDNA